jgi:hypothetical protein
MRTLSIFGCVFGVVVALVGGASVIKGLGWAKNDKSAWLVVALGLAGVIFGVWVITTSF